MEDRGSHCNMAISGHAHGARAPLTGCDQSELHRRPVHLMGLVPCVSVLGPILRRHLIGSAETGVRC